MLPMLPLTFVNGLYNTIIGMSGIYSVVISKQINKTWDEINKWRGKESKRTTTLPANYFDILKYIVY